MKLALSFCGVVLATLNLFAAGKQLTGQFAPAESPALAPAESQKKFVVPDGFEVRLFASEPDVVNPVAMTWDERGRLWVLELYEYPLGAPEGQKGRDRIKILEDTDGDGRADKVTIFADGFNLATGLLLGNGGVYVGQAPDLLFLQDTNHDDKADTRQVLLTGFGLHDRHELLNGFTWGPDGWLYMTHGVFNSSKVKIPEATTPGVEMTAAVARFHPQTKRFEIFADGTSNPWGVDFDRYGNAFVSACVIDHLFHLAPGGIYQRQGGVPENPYSYELLPSIVNHKHDMAAYCGVCIYQGDMFPEEYRGTVFMGNIHQSAINRDKLTPNGSSFKATALPDFLTSGDGWFRPVSEQVGPDGALWIADWYDKYPCYQNAQADPEGVDREHGRIWRVVYTGKKKEVMQSQTNIVTKLDAFQKLGGRDLEPFYQDFPWIHSRGDVKNPKFDLSKLSEGELVSLLEHPNIWQRRTAYRLLLEHHLDRLAIPAYLNVNNFFVQSCLLYGESDAIARSWVTNFARPTSAPTSRVLAARFLGYKRDSSPEALAILEKLASDTDPRVRLAVATAARQIVSSSLTVDAEVNDTAPIGKILSALIKASADAKDPLLPFMIWMAGEPIIAKHPQGGLKWLAENGASTMPLSGILARKTMRRICDTGEVEKMNQAVAFLGAIVDKPELAVAALDGLIEGQKAKPLQPTVPTSEMLSKLDASDNASLRERAEQLGTIWGNATAIEKTLAVVNDSSVSVKERTKAVQSMKQLKSDSARDALLKLITNEKSETLVSAALQSLSAMGGENVAPTIVKNWKRYSPGERRAAGDVLTSRSVWTDALLGAVENKIIQPDELSASVLRSIGNYNNTNFNSRVANLIGKYRESSADKVALIKQKRKMVLGGEPDINHGHEVAKRTCFVCHKLHGEGADVGPDLTGVGRSSLDALLANVIDPNQIVGKGYELVEVETKDGRSVSGRLVEETDSRIRLLAAGPTENIVAKSDIESKRVSQLSVMPEGLEQMPDQDFRDLVWFILSPPQEGALTPEKRKALSGK